MGGFTARIEIQGGRTVNLTPTGQSLRYSTAAVGGFASCTFTVRGIHARIPHLAMVRLFYGTALVWEGRIEDRGYSISTDDLTTTFTCFGFSRALDATTCRRIWTQRSLDWVTGIAPVGDDGRGSPNTLVSTTTLQTATGTYDPTDLTKVGVKVSGVPGTADFGYWDGAEAQAPAGLSWQRIMGDYVTNGAGLSTIIQKSLDGSTYTQVQLISGTGSFSISVPSAIRIRVGAVGESSLFPVDSTMYCSFANMRFLGTSLTEDTTGGFYGGTILNDLIALIPDIALGVIEAGSDFAIQDIDYGVRATARDIVTFIASFYAREWAVWDNRRFNWATPNLDEAQYILTLADLTSLDLQSSVDALTKTSYVLYTDAASGLMAESNASSSDQRNPFVRVGQTKDELVQAPAVMTANTSAGLAARAAADHGAWPPITGTIVVPAYKLVQNAVGSRTPALEIRAGSNILISDLPKTDLFSRGRDGETLFHIDSTEVDLDAGTVTLTVEGQLRYLDVLMARLAAATRVLTG